MIPKTIHYCWLSGEKMPDEFIKYVEGWRKTMPDYEFRPWDMHAMEDCDSPYFRRMVAERRFAFASDYVRLHALYNYGGIYLDCDVEVLKSFDTLLNLPYFLCREDTKHGIEAAIIGAEKGCIWIKECIEYYDSRNMVDVQPEVMPSMIRKVFGQCGMEIRHINRMEDYSTSAEVVNLFPQEWFSPKSYVTGKVKVTGDTFCIHHFAGSWQPKWKKVLLKIWVPFYYRWPRIGESLKHMLERRKC